jgi:hypothetical protein
MIELPVAYTRGGEDLGVRVAEQGSVVSFGIRSVGLATS